MPTVLRTARLRLEPFEDHHFEGLLALNSEPSVMQFIGDGTPDTAEDVRDEISKAKGYWSSVGFGWWAIRLAHSEEIIGAGCIQRIENKSINPFEVGWRLRPDKWGKGFATEAGRGMIAFAFDELEVPRIFAVAHPSNDRSIRVMERLGMRSADLQHHYDRLVATYVLDRVE